MFPRFLSRPLALLSLVAALAAGSCTRRNAPDGPETWLLAPEESHYGMTYAEWGARWWQWAYELPRTNHPLWDEVGTDADRGQVDPVWFIGGIFGDLAVGRVGSAERTITVPSGKALFFPIINVSCDNTMCGAPDTTMSFTEMRQISFDVVENVLDVYCNLDGVSLVNSPTLTDAARFRAIMPEFSVSIPEDNIHTAIFCGPANPMPARAVNPVAADGIWMMIGPMPPGGHTLRFGGTFPVPNLFHLDIVYHINVLP